MNDHVPNPIDIHVGRRIRQRRHMVGITQERLAESLGLTFQQVQKYERGTNRVSASKLYEIARALSCSIAFFFAGLPDPEDRASAGAPIDPDADPMGAFAVAPMAQELARVYPQLRGDQKGSLVRLAVAMLPAPEAQAAA